MVEEAAPLVVDDEQRAAFELRRFDEGVDDVGDERLADADVAVRVLVAGGPLFLALERGVDEGDRRQRPARAALVVLLHLAGAREPRRAPERRDRDVGVEVAVGDARLGERGEDRRVREAERARRANGSALSFMP